MSDDQTKRLLQLGKLIQAELKPLNTLPSEVAPTADQPVLPQSLFINTRGYIEKVGHQVNRCYAATCYDACYVMIRRLLEMLIIECYVHHKREGEVKDADGNFFMLADLITKAVADFSRLNRNSKKCLADAKKSGDLSAHGGRYTARREYIDELIVPLRTTVEDLLYEAGLRK